MSKKIVLSGIIVLGIVAGGFIANSNYVAQVDKNLSIIKNNFSVNNIDFNYSDSNKSLFSSNIELLNVSFNMKNNDSKLNIGKLTFDRFSFDRTSDGMVPFVDFSLKDASFENYLTKIVYQKPLNFDIDYYHDYNLKTNSFVNKINLDLKDLGSIYFDSAFINAESVWEKISNSKSYSELESLDKKEYIKNVLGNTSIQGSTFKFKNDGVIELVNTKAYGVNSYDEAKAILLKKNENQKDINPNVYEMINNFINDPKTISAKINPAKPLKIIDILNAFDNFKNEDEFYDYMKKDLNLIISINE